MALHHLHWLAVRNLPGFGPVTINQYWKKCASIEDLWQQIQIDPAVKNHAFDQAQQEYAELKQQTVKVLTPQDQQYPKLLAKLPDAPPVLYVKGDADVLNQVSVGIVGSRQPSSYGRQITTDLVSGLVQNSMVIVSGMARGIDTIAHIAAVESGGQTIAVWGSGLDKPYPSGNSALADKISRNGAIVSQYPLGTEAQSFTFPARNKTIAGLSQAIIVTEAKAKSGSLITADAAFGIDRPVFAMPGSIYNSGSQGPHQLIRQGAQLLLDSTDIVSKLGVQHAPAVTKSHQDLSAEEQVILAQLQSHPLQVDEIIRQTGQSSAQTSSLLVMLEIKGVVKHLGSGLYCKA